MKRMEHLNRLKKIKNRSPGSSTTLDNQPPEVLPVFYDPTGIILYFVILTNLNSLGGAVKNQLIFNENK